MKLELWMILIIIVIIIAIVAYYMLPQLIALMTKATVSGRNEDFEDYKIIKKSDDLYISHRNGLTYVFEKLDDNNRNFWKEFIEYQKSNIFDKSSNITDGLNMFKLSIDVSEKSDDDVYIVYIYDELNLGEKDMKKIVMATTTLTNKDARFWTTVGIFKTTGYMHIKKDEYGGKYRSLSIPLHEFSFKTMKVIEKETNQKEKYFMITNPAPLMTNIMMAKLPKDTYYVADEKTYYMITDFEKFKEIEKEDLAESYDLSRLKRRWKRQGKNIEEETKKYIEDEIENSKILSDYLKERYKGIENIRKPLISDRQIKLESGEIIDLYEGPKMFSLQVINFSDLLLTVDLDKINDYTKWYY